MFWAKKGEGAWCNHRRMHVSDVRRLRQALVATGFPYTRATEADNNLSEFSAIMPQVQGVRRGGSAVLDLAYLADGRLDAYWEKRLSPWDWAAGCLLVQEAGGTMTGMYGEPWTLARKHAAVSNRWLHDELLALLNAARPASRE
jgi:myo-inositol-1(or 4)-monophosphatase